MGFNLFCGSCYPFKRAQKKHQCPSIVYVVLDSLSMDILLSPSLQVDAAFFEHYVGPLVNNTRCSERKIFAPIFLDVQDVYDQLMEGEAAKIVLTVALTSLDTFFYTKNGKPKVQFSEKFSADQIKAITFYPLYLSKHCICNIRLNFIRPL